VRETSIIETLGRAFALEISTIDRIGVRVEATWIAINLSLGSKETIELLCQD
jgi:hypothetical protein